MLKYLLFILLIPVSVFAQNNVTGKVVNVMDKNPVAGASVFLNNSVIGSATDKDGIYKLNNVKNGEYELVVTCIGYEDFHGNISVYNGSFTLVVIQLQPKVNTLDEVTIAVPKNDARRRRYIRMFTNAFFGNTKNALECQLLNPDVLRFHYDNTNDRLIASARDFLLLENKALGYRIKYRLVSFEIDPGSHTIYYTGSSAFIPMDTTAEQQKIWEKKRVKAYLGSEMHFLRNCITGDNADWEFTVRKLGRIPNPDRPPDSVIYTNIKHYQAMPNANGDLQYWIAQDKIKKYDQEVSNRHLSIQDIVTPTNAKGVYAFTYPDPLLINYGPGRNELLTDNTVITFVQDVTYFDSNGIIINPQSNRVEGVWGTLRMADTLPVDYELPKDWRQLK